MLTCAIQGSLPRVKYNLKLLLGYSGITQFFPGVVLGLYWKRATMRGVFAGMATGVATVAVLALGKQDLVFGLNPGFVALCLNFLVTVGLSTVSTRFMSRRTTFPPPVRWPEKPGW